MSKNIYVVTYASYCVRDVQIWQKDPDDIDPMSDDWTDLLGSNAEVFVDVFEAEDRNEAIRMAAEKEQCHPHCLNAYFICEKQK